MASIAIAVEPLKLPPVLGGAGRRLPIFPWEALCLVATLVLSLPRTAADRRQSSDKPDAIIGWSEAMLAGLVTFGYWLDVSVGRICILISINESGPADWSKLNRYPAQQGNTPRFSDWLRLSERGHLGLVFSACKNAGSVG